MDPSAGVSEDEHSALGSVREVVYAGSATRFLVDLDVGGSLMVLQQNLTTSSMDVMAFRESRVRLVWHRDHEFRVAGSTTTETARSAEADQAAVDGEGTSSTAGQHG